MSTKRRLPSPSPVALGALLLWLASPCHADEPELRVGLGVSLLAAPMDAPLAGYGGVSDRLAHGVLDAPEARALVFERGSLRIALVVLDLVIVRPVLREGLEAAAAELEIDTVVVVATHTHSGPGGYVDGFVAERITAGGFDSQAPVRLLFGATRALERAVADLGTARLASTTAQLDLARNRRRADGPREQELPLLRADFADGRTPIVLFAYGAHPTVLSPASHDYSADYPGAARARLAALGWRAVFAPGPLGDQQPHSDLGPLWPSDLAAQREQRHEIGTRLGDAVERTLAQLGRGDQEQLAAASIWITPREPRPRRFCALWWLSPLIQGSLERFLSARAPLTVLRLGDAHLVAVPAEPASSVGDAIRAQMPATSTRFVLAHAGDWLGYVVSAEDYARGGYEACLSFHGPGLAEQLTVEAGAALRLLDSARPPAGAGANE